MEDFALKLFTLYGPLALGWVAWWFERKENAANQSKLIELFTTSAATMAALRQMIEERLPRLGGRR